MENKFTNFLSCFYANTPQNTGGGNSHSSTVVTPVWKGSRPTVSRQSTDSQRQDHRNHTPISKALKYAAMILMALTLGVGQMWGTSNVYTFAFNDAIKTAYGDKNTTVLSNPSHDGTVVDISSYASSGVYTGGTAYVTSSSSKENCVSIANDAAQNFGTYYVEIHSTEDISSIYLVAAVTGSTTASEAVAVGWTGTPSADIDEYHTFSTPGKGGTSGHEITINFTTEGIKYVRFYRKIKLDSSTKTKFQSSSSATIPSSASTYGIAFIKVTTEASEAPSCSTPTAPTGLAVGSITGSGATFTITDGADANNYEIVCKESSTTPASDATPTETGTSKTIAVTGLDGGTTYYAWVRAVCDASHKSSWVALGSTFTTLQAITPSLSYANNPLVLTVRTSGAPTLTGNTGSGTVTWNSSAEGVATVDASGNITAVAAGTTTITASIAANGGYAAGEATATVKVAAAPLGIVDQKLATGNVAWDASVIVTSDYTNIANITALSQHGSATASGNGNTSNGGQTSKVGTATGDFNDANYLELSFDVASGKKLDITAVHIPVQPVSSDVNNFKAVLSDDQGSTEIVGTKTNQGNGTLADITFSSYGSLKGTVTLSIYAWGWSNGYRLGKNIYITGTIEDDAACAAPTAVTIAPTEIAGNYGWRYSKGETIDLTCSYTGGTGTPSYQWQKYVTSDWEDIDGATSARLQIEDCASTDGGSYRCVVSMGSDCDLASDGYFLRVFTLNGNYEGEEDWLENAITWTGEKTGTATLNLTESSIYNFKVTDNNGKWFGYSENNFILGAINWNCGTGNSDCRLFTGPAGNYVATINIEHANDGSPYVNIQLAYPSVSHPAAGYAYFKKWNDWAGYYIHWWYNDGSDHPLTTWGSDVQITNETTICANDYIYFPVLGKYNQLKIKDAAGDASHKTNDLSSTCSSGKYFDFTNEGAWNTFSTSTISFAGNGNTSGSMSAIEGICPHADQALTANAFAKSGYNFTGWVADVDVTVGESTITAGNLIEDAVTLKDINSNIALTAQWESNCPTSGVIYSMTMKSGFADVEGVSQNTEIVLAGTYATESGGTAALGNKNATASKALMYGDKGGGTIMYNGNDAYVKIVLDCPLATGDRITITNGYETKEVCFTTTNSRATTYSTSSQSYELPAAFNEASTIYVWRVDGGTYLHSLTISRPANYDITYTTPSNGSYTIKVGDAEAVSENTTAKDGQTVTLSATPSSGYQFSAWDVYKTGDASTKVSMTNNQFTMPEYAVTVSATFAAIPTVDDLVTISDDYTFTPSATIAAGTLAESNKLFASGENDCDYNSDGMRIKENRALAFKVNNGAKVKVTFAQNGDREMKLGTAMTGDDSKVYGNSKTSPVIFDVTADGVVYLTTTSDLRFTKLEIMYPHTVTYALGDGTGTLPTEGSHYKGEQFNVHDGETDITAPENKEFSVWSDGTSTYAGGAQYTMGSSNVILTAQWVAALPAPTITFNNGNYTIAGAALDLSSLFTSNSDGAVTYTVKTAGETGASIAGTSFTATAAGSAVVTASQAATASYKAKSVDATITVSAPTEPEGVKLVEDNTLTGNFRSSRTLSDGSCTVAGINYSKYITMSSTYNSWGPDAGEASKYISYTVQKKSTKFYFYLNNTGSAAKLNVYTSAEGSAAAATKHEVDVAAGTSLVTYDLATTTNTEVFIGVSSTNIRFCQIVAVESGDSHLTAPAVGYAMSLNKGRLSAKSGTGTTMDGLTFVLSSGYKPADGTYAQIGTKGTQYVSFTIPTGQTRQLQLTTSNKESYTVSKTLGDDTNPYTPKANNETKNWNLTAGTWYINPQGSNVNITNIAFDETPDPITVTFKDGASTLSEQALFAGDKVTEPSPAPTKDGYRFVEWQLSGSAYDFDDEVTEDITLDAVWQQTWTVTFDSDGGSDVAAATVDNGAAVAKPADPTKVGFDFVEWQLNSAAYNFASAVTSNITLVATWVVAQTDASLSALSYNSNAIDVNSAVEIEGVQTYTVHLQWGSTVDDDLISVTKSAETATISEISYDSENLKATFSVESGNHTVTINYAIQFVIDAKRGTSIIKATTNNVVTGLIGGTRDTNLDDGNTKKLNSNTYFGVTLTNDETFQEGDVFIVNITTPADLGKFMIYADKERTELIADQGIVYTKPDVENPVICPTGEMQMVLPEAATGKKSLYLSRENGTTQWNPVFSYVEVTREMNPAIKSFKFGDDAAIINEGAKTISIDVPYGTDVTALTPTVEAYGNNGATYTPTGAQDFTSPVNYVVTDAYSELSTTYEVSINVAAPSENADLASLAVAGYSLNFDPAVLSYDVLLNYGTTVLPTITYEVADQVSPATAVKVEGGVNGATTITVTPQAGAGYNKVYTINFSVSQTPKFVIYDGSTMTNIASATGSDVATGFSYSIGSGIGLSGNAVAGSWSGKNYANVIKGFKPNDNANNVVSFVIPENYMAKVCLVGATNSDDAERKMFIANVASRYVSDAIGDYIITSSTYDAEGFITDFLPAGTYYLGTTDSYRLYEFSVQLYHIDFTRATTPGRLGTICLEKGGTMRGATLYEVAYFNPDNRKIYFDEIIGGEMEPGMPYVFIPEEDNDNQLVVMYGNNVPAAVAGHHNGLYGSFTKETLTPNDGNYIFSENLYWYVTTSPIYVGQNRAYLKVAQISGYNGEPEPTPAPGRRRVTLDSGDQAPQITTGLENLHAGDQPVKMIINGQIFILRGEKMYDVTGKLVK